MSASRDQMTIEQFRFSTMRFFQRVQSKKIIAPFSDAIAVATILDLSVVLLFFSQQKQDNEIHSGKSNTRRFFFRCKIAAAN